MLEVQRMTIVEIFLPPELRSTNVILGMRWLGALGNMEINWKLLTMKFQIDETVRTFKGDLELNKAGVSLKTMMKTL